MATSIDEVLAGYETGRINFVESNRYDELPDDFKGDFPSPFKYMGLQFSEVIEPCADNIINCLNDPSKTIVRQTYNGEPVRISLLDVTPAQSIIDFFESYFNKPVVEVQINRNCVTQVPSYVDVEDCDKSNYWISQYWHIDNYQHNNFSVGIYLNDVEDGDGQFEYLNNPDQYYYNTKDGDWKSTRFNMLQPSDNQIGKILGSKYTTFFFVPNFIHRGTFARSKPRDFLRLLF